VKKNSRGDQLLHCVLDPRGFPDLARSPENELARLRTFEFLLEMGADVNAPNEHLETPLQLAVLGGNEAIIRKLLKEGAKINGAYQPGEHPVQLAVATGNSVIAGLLLDRGADVIPDGHVDYGDPPLHLAVRRADLEMTQFLLQRLEKDGRKPLGALRPLLAPLVKHPLPDPIPEHRKDDARRRVVIAKLLLQTGAIPNQLHAAATANHSELVRLLLEAGADPNLANPSLTSTRGLVPIHIAASHANLDVVNTLLSKGAKASDPKYARRRQAIHYAIRPQLLEKRPDKPEQRVAVVKALLKAGVQPDSLSASRWRPLHEAVASGNPGMVDLLLQEGADANAVTHAGRTPLHLSSSPNSLEIGKLLVKHGAKVDLEDRHRQLQPIHYAAKRGELELVAFLLQTGAKVDAADGSYRLQTIHHAASAGQVAMVKFLLDQGAKIDAVNFQEKQPLHVAASYGWTKTVQFLLDQGADPQALDSRGNTPLAWAKKHNRPACVAVLEKLESK
jgi:ankyrin repeat protein